MRIIVFLLLLFSYCAQAADIDTKKVVNYLCSDALAGRLTGSKGEKLATQYIANQFAQLGLEPAGDNGTYFQNFNFSSKLINKQRITQHGRNVLATLKLSANPESIIVIGAHIDHLGRGEAGGSRADASETGKIHRGADDNASGVATVLEIAAKLANLKSQGKLSGNKDILFAAWSGEEIGLLGSSHFVKTSRKIDAAINLDMVGRLKQKLIIQGVGSSPDWQAILKTSNVIEIITQKDPYLPTDSTSFYLAGIPAINFFTGANNEYHRPSDKPNLLNYTGIKNISNYITDLTLRLEKNPNLTYIEVEKPKETRVGVMKIYLGTIPDYASADDDGVKLAGVIKHSPAEHAGIERGDTIIQLAEKNIHDIYDYSRELNSLPIGKPVKLIVIRKGARLTLTIIAKSRQDA